ncbi:PREDICTED: uncharacterized protein LOC109240017 [Nicotiana attenuata]|uniref:uncharacterized protein LOC109240017 n=1 Tax=Nicotiana attenuata TaxID=49451 RepID=UPI000905138B|nr:PREDICTED: uncharacterized protein LOC109240017 [Nicotiana attenuata]
MYVKWHPPARDTIKPNIDRAAKTTTSTNGIGGIFRSTSGQCLMGFMGARSSGNSTCMELNTLLQGLQLAKLHQLTPLEVNVDSTVVIMILNNDNLHYSSSLVECRYLLQQLGNPSITHTYREQNYTAHYLAQYGSSTNAQVNATIFTQPPDFLLPQLVDDQKGTAYQRLVKSTCTTDLSYNPTLVAYDHSIDPLFDYNSCNTMQLAPCNVTV